MAYARAKQTAEAKRREAAFDRHELEVMRAQLMAALSSVARAQDKAVAAEANLTVAEETNAELVRALDAAVAENKALQSRVFAYAKLLQEATDIVHESKIAPSHRRVLVQHLSSEHVRISCSSPPVAFSLPLAGLPSL